MVNKKKYAMLVDPNLWTAQEHEFVGSTPEIIPKKGSKEIYIPQVVLEWMKDKKKGMSPEQAREARKGKYFESVSLASVIGILDKTVILSVSDIDIENGGQTKHDPTIIGLSDGQTVRRIRGLKLRILKGCAKEGIDLHLRPPRDKEGERAEPYLNKALRYLTVEELVYLRLIRNDDRLTKIHELRKPLDIALGKVSADKEHILYMEEQRNNLFRVGELKGSALLPELPQIFDAGKRGVVGLPKLDPGTGEAKRHPEIIDLWDMEEERVLKPTQEELVALNIRFLDHDAETRIRLPLRDLLISREKERVGGVSEGTGAAELKG